MAARKPNPGDKTIRVQFDALDQSQKNKVVGDGVSDILKANRPLPGLIDVEKFVTSRAFEVFSMNRAQSLAKSSTTLRAFQTLPRHLRRRAASHNPRRVPKRLRSKAAFEIDSADRTVKNQVKRIEKRKRRIAKGLDLPTTEKWLARQKTKQWLETHVWHAKRAHMTNIWTYRLALTPTAKSHRPSHRAAHNGCIVGDVSYVSTIQLSGLVEDLRGAMKGVIAGNGWSGKRYEHGGRCGRAGVWKFGEWPQGYIGPVEVIWQAMIRNPQDGQEEDNEMRKVWLRFHPAMFDDTWNSLSNSISAWFDSQSATTNHRSAQQPIKMNDLRNDICAFELVGPKSASVLHSVLGFVREQDAEVTNRPQSPTLVQDESTEQTSPAEEMKEGQDVNAMDIDPEPTLLSNASTHPNSVKKQWYQSLKSAQSSGQSSRGLIVGLQVHDPRLRFPPRLAPSLPESCNGGGLEASEPIFPSAGLAHSNLWDQSVRESLRRPRFKKADLDRRRHEKGLPGTRLQPTLKDDRLPVMVIQKSLVNGDDSSLTSHESSGSGVYGYTLLVPAGWSMPFWQSLVFTGSLVSGLDERRTQHLEAGVPAFPYDFPTTEAGRGWWKGDGEERKRKWDKKPKGKRVAYDEGTAPWQIEWERLNRDQSEPATPPWLVPTWPMQGFWAGLAHLSVNSNIVSSTVMDWFFKVMTSCALALGVEPIPQPLQVSVWKQAMVHVSVRVAGRGSPKPFGEVWGVNREEVRLLKSKYFDQEQAFSPRDEPKEPWIGSSPRLGYIVSGTQSLARGQGFGIAVVSLPLLLTLPDTAVVWAENRRDEETGKVDDTRPGDKVPMPSTSGKQAMGPWLVKIRNPEGLVWRYAWVDLILG